jgi:hypothetical protein
MQFVDIAFLVVAIFVALWLPLKLGLAGAAKEITKIDSPTWESLGQNPTMVAAWEKLGYTAQTAHDVIQNRFNYSIDWLNLIIMTVVLIGYYVFLFRASDAEYREVIAEKTALHIPAMKRVWPALADGPIPFFVSVQ